MEDIFFKNKNKKLIRIKAIALYSGVELPNNTPRKEVKKYIGGNIYPDPVKWKEYNRILKILLLEKLSK